MEAALSNGRCAWKKDLTPEALLVVPAQEDLLRILTLGRTPGLKQRGGIVVRKDGGHFFFFF